jgi:hypothetical protein
MRALELVTPEKAIGCPSTRPKTTIAVYHRPMKISRRGRYNVPGTTTFDAANATAASL